jgi:hypothetical protein
MTRPLDPAWPQLDRSEVEWLWFHDWYDGPMLGLGRFRGQKVWLEMWSWAPGPSPMVVYALTPAQAEAEEVWNTRFEAEVGRGSSHAQARFYADQAARADVLDLATLPVLGWYLSE